MGPAPPFWLMSLPQLADWWLRRHRRPEQPRSELSRPCALAVEGQAERLALEGNAQSLASIASSYVSPGVASSSGLSPCSVAKRSSSRVDGWQTRRWPSAVGAQTFWREIF